MTLLCVVGVVLVTGLATACGSDPAAGPAVSAEGGGLVSVSGAQLLRDGRPWVPRGFYQIAFEAAPEDFPLMRHDPGLPFSLWENAYRHYTPDEYRDMRSAGADSVRLQISQLAAANPRDRAWLDQALGAVSAARRAGLTVIVALQTERHVPGPHGDEPIEVPGPVTRQVWRDEIAPRFAHDRGVLYELLNEPGIGADPANWPRWQQAMSDTVAAVRRTGAQNVVVADGMAFAHVLDGAPGLGDPQVVYAAHPYALDPRRLTPPPPDPAALPPWFGARGQQRPSWDTQFGTFAQHHPVIVTEWGSGGFYCDPRTPEATLDFFRYLVEHRVGLEVGTWDWSSGGFGSARWTFPPGADSTFADRACHQAGYGLGASVAAWYRTGTVPDHPL